MAGGRIGQVHIEVGRAAQELHLFKGARAAAGEHILVGGGAVVVHPVAIDGQPLARHMHALEVTIPVLDQGSLDLADDTRLNVGEGGAPFIGILAYPMRVAHDRRPLAFVAASTDDIVGKVALKFGEGDRVLRWCDGQHTRAPAAHAPGFEN